MLTSSKILSAVILVFPIVHGNSTDVLEAHSQVAMDHILTTPSLNQGLSPANFAAQRFEMDLTDPGYGATLSELEYHLREEIPLESWRVRLLDQNTYPSRRYPSEERLLSLIRSIDLRDPNQLARAIHVLRAMEDYGVLNWAGKVTTQVNAPMIIKRASEIQLTLLREFGQEPADPISATIMQDNPPPTYRRLFNRLLPRSKDKSKR